MLIANAKVVTMTEPNHIIKNGGVRIQDGVITDVAGTKTLADRYPEEGMLDAEGQWMLPGNLCAHTHFYGALARGMALDTEAAADFRQILERLWWRLDKALQPEDIRISALVCLIDAIRHGTTTLFDHHASPNCIDGSLDIISEAIVESGVSACLCYETSDRDGAAVTDAGLRENERFARLCAKHNNGQLAAAIGLHAAMTCSDRTLDRAAALAQDLGLGCHLHVSEAIDDPLASLSATGQRTVHRLGDHGILGPQTIAAHGVRLTMDERRRLAETGTWVIHNPRSNMNNAVGTAKVPEMLVQGIHIGLGNDGFSNDMFAEMKAAYLAQKAAQGDPRAMPADDVWRLAVVNNRALAQRYFQTPRGILSPGAAADLILLDYDPPTPVTADNWPWHAIFGIHGGMTTATIARGQLLMWDRLLIQLDENAIHACARELAAALWQRI